MIPGFTEFLINQGSLVAAEYLAAQKPPGPAATTAENASSTKSPIDSSSENTDNFVTKNQSSDTTQNTDTSLTQIPSINSIIKAATGYDIGEAFPSLQAKESQRQPATSDDTESKSDSKTGTEKPAAQKSKSEELTSSWGKWLGETALGLTNFVVNPFSSTAKLISDWNSSSEQDTNTSSHSNENIFTDTWNSFKSGFDKYLISPAKEFFGSSYNDTKDYLYKQFQTNIYNRKLYEAQLAEQRAQQERYITQTNESRRLADIAYQAQLSRQAEYTRQVEEARYQEALQVARAEAESSRQKSQAEAVNKIGQRVLDIASSLGISINPKYESTAAILNKIARVADSTDLAQILSIQEGRDVASIKDTLSRLGLSNNFKAALVSLMNGATDNKSILAA